MTADAYSTSPISPAASGASGGQQAGGDERGVVTITTSARDVRAVRVLVVVDTT